MKERPILFSAPMVRAILEGRKTQTRRVMKPQPPMGDHLRPKFTDSCPYGVPEDRLWVRETWQCGRAALPSGAGLFPLLGKIPATPWEGLKVVWRESWDGEDQPPWRPAIFMPRWASRITLEVTRVGIERLQTIDEAGAILEGFLYAGHGDDWHRPDSFRVLWDNINAARGFGWDANPWVWVVEFQRVPE